MSKDNLEVSKEVSTLITPPARSRSGLNLLKMAEKAIQTRLDDLLKYEKRMHGGTDIEALHDMRVASRRLREALRIYAELFSQKRLKQGMRAVRRVTRALGLVREVDVNVEQLEAWRDELGEAYAIPLEYSLAMEQSRQRRLRKKMFARLDELDMDELEADISKLLQHPHRDAQTTEGEDEGGGPDLPVIFARRHIESGLGSILPCVARVSSKPTLHEYHRLRIQVKKFRYSLELLSRAFDSHRAIRILKQLKLLQDELGILHDSSVLHSTVRSLRAELRKSGLSHLERHLLRLMRVLAVKQNTQRKRIGAHLRRLALLRFFERIPAALKEGPTSPAIQPALVLHPTGDKASA
ncbi:MAG: CHAD domain-containing protein [Terriglobia bacterium]